MKYLFVLTFLLSDGYSEKYQTITYRSILNEMKVSEINGLFDKFKKEGYKSIILMNSLRVIDDE
ncbi:MAG: hypothetical protein IJ809_02620 [Clostridia bacterium]|nr:hypothetical protein [Clostridia bacterium]